MKEHKIKVKYHEDPFKVALNHTRCPICNKELDKTWTCHKCKIFLTFVQHIKHQYSFIK